jgi:hypothetical protein
MNQRYNLKELDLVIEALMLNPVQLTSVWEHDVKEQSLRNALDK